MTVRVPKGFAMTTTGAKLHAAVDGTDRVFSSGAIAATADWQACFAGTNAGAYRTERLEGPGGATIRLRSWPEDEAWADGVRADVASSLPLLARLTGVAPTATGTLDIREGASGGVASGGFDPERNLIMVGEDFGEPALVQHELAHAWFNASAFAEPWLSEGFAEWAGRAVAGEKPCGEPDGDAGTIDLAHWATVTPASSEAERSAAVAQYLAACHVITVVADTAGEERMTTAIIALLGPARPVRGRRRRRRDAGLAGRPTGGTSSTRSTSWRWTRPGRPTASRRGCWPGTGSRPTRSCWPIAPRHAPRTGTWRRRRRAGRRPPPSAGRSRRGGSRRPPRRSARRTGPGR